MATSDKAGALVKTVFNCITSLKLEKEYKDNDKNKA